MKSPDVNKKDRRILHFLDRNCRASLSELAESVGLSKQNVHYRMRRLEGLGAITGYASVINTHALGYPAFRIYFRYRDINEEPRAIEYLLQSPHVLWFVSMVGSWDLEAVFLARSSTHCSNLLKELKMSLPGVFHEFHISPSMVNYHFSRDYLIGSERKQLNVPYYGKEPRQIEIDETDICLLKELCGNSRLSNREIAMKIGTSHQTVRRRLDVLKEKEVVQQHKVVLDLDKIGRKYYKALLYLDSLTLEQESSLLAYCGQYNFVVYLIESVGDWQYEIEAEVESEDEFTGFLRNLRSSFPDLIRKLELLHIIKQHKLNYFPIADMLLDSKQKMKK